MRIVVTGAGGFLGSEVIARLSDKGHEVLPLSHRESGDARRVDLTDATQLKRVSWKCDVLIHTAARVPETFEGGDVDCAAEINRVMDRNVFEYSARRNIAVVYASTTSVYPPRTTDALTNEESETAPRGPYSEAKLESEAVGRELLGLRGIPFAALRINAPYGPGQRARTVLQMFLERLLEGQALFYYGAGTREQDFTFVADVASAIEHASTRRVSGVFNVSGGRPISMKALAQLLVDMYPHLHSRVVLAAREDEQEGVKARFSCRKAALELGWIPTTTLEEGLRACFEAIAERRC